MSAWQFWKHRGRLSFAIVVTGEYMVYCTFYNVISQLDSYIQSRLLGVGIIIMFVHKTGSDSLLAVIELATNFLGS